MWRTKPDAELNINISLEQLVLDSIKRQEAEKPEVIDPVESDLPQLADKMRG
jgi:hypothetical protein